MKKLFLGLEVLFVIVLLSVVLATPAQAGARNGGCYVDCGNCCDNFGLSSEYCLVACTTTWCEGGVAACYDGCSATPACVYM